MKKIIGKWLALIGVICAFISLNACQALSAEIHHHSLNVESKMSNPVFLDQLADNGKNIYVRVFNTSSEHISDLSYSIKGRLTDHGYKIINDPKLANYILQVNVLQFGKVNMREFDKLYKSDQNFGQSAITGVAAGGATALLGGGMGTSLAVGAGSAMLSWFSNELVENETYSLITNIRIEEVVKGRAVKRYDTQIASKADKVNLKFAEAKPALVEQVSKEITGIFADNN